MSFVHLHVHDRYSPLEGIGEPKEWAAMAKANGHPALAITNTGNLFNAYYFYKECNAAGVKPIFGEEFYMVPSDDMRTDKSKQGQLYRVVVLAMNQVGWKTLVKLSSAAFVEGHHYVPRIDRATLEGHKEGLLVMAPGLRSDIGNLWLAGDEKQALRLAQWYREAFPNFCLEIVPHSNIEQVQFNHFVASMAGSDGFKLVAGNNCRYLRADQARYYDYLLMLKAKKKKADYQRRTPLDHHFKTRVEMERGLLAQRFDSTLVAGWLDESGRIAEAVEPVVFDKSFKLPVFDNTPVEIDIKQVPKEAEEEDLLAGVQ